MSNDHQYLHQYLNKNTIHVCSHQHLAVQCVTLPKPQKVGQKSQGQLVGGFLPPILEKNMRKAKMESNLPQGIRDENSKNLWNHDLWPKLFILGMVIPPLLGNSLFHGYINPYKIGLKPPPRSILEFSKLCKSHCSFTSWIQIALSCTKCFTHFLIEPPANRNIDN